MKYYHFLGELNERQTHNIIKFLLECKRDNEEAVMLINSPGGSINCLESIYEILMDTEVRLTTIGVGMVASSAAIIFAMGDERIILQNTKYLIHHARQIVNRTTLQGYDYEIGATEARAILERNVEMLQKTKITKEVFEERCLKGSDWVLTPDELKEYDVITKDAYKGWTNLLIQCMSNGYKDN